MEKLSDDRKREKDHIKCCSPEIIISLLIGDSGKCSSEYGGVVVKVLNPKEFPWEQVFRTLLNLNHEVFVDERDGSLMIVSKPKTD
ncbi:MAG: hypothetical protein NZ918_03500 [Aigarchaeota archaeon]|nr:hypothetical protein [Aigarchaeota archaeon]